MNFLEPLEPLGKGKKFTNIFSFPLSGILELLRLAFEGVILFG
jgi:hypothetical protein